MDLAMRTAATAPPIVFVATTSTTAVATPAPMSARDLGDRVVMEALEHRVPLLAFAGPAG